MAPERCHATAWEECFFIGGKVNGKKGGQGEGRPASGNLSSRREEGRERRMKALGSGGKAALDYPPL